MLLSRRVVPLLSDLDIDFGDIRMFEQTPPEELPSQRTNMEQIAHLSSSEQNELLNLLDKYHMCFTDNPGLSMLAQHEINLLPVFKPKSLKAYRVRGRLKPQVSCEIQRMLEMGIIRPSNSDTVSPFVVVQKSPAGQGGIKLAVDHFYLNLVTRHDPFPVGDIDSRRIMNRVVGVKLISTHDAACGYWQTLVRPENIPLTAFICDDGIFEFLRIPFGGRSCGSTYIRAMQQVLKPIKGFTTTHIFDLILHKHANGNNIFGVYIQQIEP